MAVSNTAAVVLTTVPTFDASVAAGMTATLPHHPQVVGDVFIVDIKANTNGHALNVWVLSVNYDSNVLTYQSTSTSSKYISAVVTQETKPWADPW